VIVPVARNWIGTPYRHQMSVKGVGCDCVGLVRGVWREVYGFDACATPVYTPDWAEVGAEERLIEGLGRFLTAVPVAEAEPGDVLVFRMKPGAVAKHTAILSEGSVAEARAKIVHAYWGHAVVESWLGPFWKRHVVAGFKYPEHQK
jgi:NlpC/P60 family putative phage cell wall peptidase